MVETRSSSVPAVVMSDSASTIQTVPYDDTIAATAPIAVRSASYPTPVDCTSCSEETSHSASSGSAWDQSGPAPSQQNARSRRNRFTALPEAGASTVSLRSLRNSIPSIIVNDTASRPASRPGSRPGSRWSERRWGGLRSKKSGEFDRDDDAPPVPPIQAPFNGIALDIPNSALDGLGPQSMRFSKRGSLIKEESKRQLQQQIEQEEARRREAAQQAQDGDNQQQRGPDDREPVSPDVASSEQNSTEPETIETPSRRSKPVSTLRVRHSAMASRAISADEDMLSRRVRLMYEKGEENVTDSEVAKSMAMENGILWEDTPTSMETSRLSGPSMSVDTKSVVSSLGPENGPAIKREAHELAGGIEYWQNIKAGDVDRYGFIRSPTSNSNEGIDPSPIQRVSTSLLMASETPRRKHSIRPPSAIGGNRPFSGLTGRSPTRKMSEPSIRPTSSHSMYSTTMMRRSTSRFRRAANHLPHNRDRRVKDEASDMLTHPTAPLNPGEKQDAAAARAARKKEWEREDKWTKMARPMRSGDGGGMTFEFDTTSSKLIERTWKGIPDRWRATAWYAFLKSSARMHSDSPSEEELIEAFNEFQLVSSPDDVQIDIDVPRTITSHIMFRRRYRGGQRLLFRVLHAMSLYFPDTGYVQGMAALAATLLAYYDEEHAFIMLVRLWQLRGLERLYQSGFSGLMEALGDFEREWLEKGEVAAKLNELGIPPTAYGTRWYLTLFNYSIPFPAQLRVWDVFMLLGDADDLTAPGSSGKGSKKDAPTSAFGNGLDVLHATSAALIDGMRDIILESDFENAMKVLTSWVPIKDIELFMRVAKAEWKVHRRKKTS
ncbi:putative TBC domain protein [Aspergillus vadensis CBS 113365]|uniref:TBC domain protein n=1 Tax=Aspergillus vadensis (strain CBS 113365 / IMI 142717 / IBT 24658) TaxID=1448311 RepID=A0A319BTK9_ASPVC|nr:TBC domain protein [Aspergillus vadensis CBS 113365]PYH74829.1 TBC domain protein [Aspergillus vadensis CBS 113365]